MKWKSGTFVAESCFMCVTWPG